MRCGPRDVSPVEAAINKPAADCVRSTLPAATAQVSREHSKNGRMSSADLSVDTIKLMTTQWHGTRGTRGCAAHQGGRLRRGRARLQRRAREGAPANRPAVLRFESARLAGWCARRARASSRSPARASRPRRASTTTRPRRNSASVTGRGRPLVRDWKLARPPPRAPAPRAAMQRGPARDVGPAEPRLAAAEGGLFALLLLKLIHGSLHVSGESDRAVRRKFVQQVSRGSRSGARVRPLPRARHVALGLQRRRVRRGRRTARARAATAGLRLVNLHLFPEKVPSPLSAESSLL